MRASSLATFVLYAVVALGGCANGSPTAPTPVEILSQPYSLICDAWSPATPPVRRTLVDVRVKGEGERVTEAELGRLRQNGGDIVHEYAAGRLVRVAIDVGRILPLFKPMRFSDGDFIAYATTVTDPLSFKVVMIVTLDHPVSDADLTAARALGGTIRNVYTHALVGYSVQIEDAMVPRLRALPGVIRTNLSGYGCLI
jgi:hypothetical protein